MSLSYTIDGQSGAPTQASGSNAYGQVIGLHLDNFGNFHSFDCGVGTFTCFDVPVSGGKQTTAIGINDFGVAG